MTGFTEYQKIELDKIVENFQNKIDYLQEMIVELENRVEKHINNSDRHLKED